MSSAQQGVRSPAQYSWIEILPLLIPLLLSTPKALAYQGASWSMGAVDTPEASSLAKPGNLETDAGLGGPAASQLEPSQPFKGKPRAQKGRAWRKEAMEPRLAARLLDWRTWPHPLVLLSSPCGL